MSNSLLTTSMITNESLMVLKNNIAFAGSVNRQYDGQFAQNGAKKGDTINIRKPVRNTVSDGAALQIQDQEDESVPLTLNYHKHIGFQFSQKDLTLSIDRFRERYLDPKVITLANQIDFDGLGLYQDVYNAVGTPGTTPDDIDDPLDAGVKLDNNGCPRDGKWYYVINSKAQAETVYALKGLFHSSQAISTQYKKGVMGEAAGYMWKMDQNVKSHTVGPLGGTPEVKTTVSAQGATVIATEAWTASAANRLKKGDIFTVAGVYAVNPQNKNSTGELQQFVATADFDSDGSGEGDISVSPAMYTTGGKQNIDAFPVDGAALTILGSANTVSPSNLAFHSDAFTLGMADFEMPKGVDMAGRAKDPDAGMSICFVRDFDINNYRTVARLDVLYGWTTQRPEWACRVQG